LPPHTKAVCRKGAEHLIRKNGKLERIMYREYENGSAAIGGRESTVDLSKGATSWLNPFCTYRAPSWERLADTKSGG
jgi:hypothetical protein